MFIERLGVKKLLDKNPLKIINYIYTMFVVIVGWAMFRCDGNRHMIHCMLCLKGEE